MCGWVPLAGVIKEKANSAEFCKATLSPDDALRRGFRLTTERDDDLDARTRIGICQPQQTTKFLYSLAYTTNADTNATRLQLRDPFGNPLAIIAHRDDQLAVLSL